MKRLFTIGLGVSMTIAACAASSPDETSRAGDLAGGQTRLRKVPGAPNARSDPFGTPPDDAGGLLNDSTDLNGVLERDALEGACERYAAGAHDRRTTLLCGKAMFFDEGFGTTGVPKPIVTFLAQNFPDAIGKGFAKLGMIPDPRSTESLPLGLAPGKKFGSVDTLAFSCASCHFGRLPDGRYSVGAPNHDYAYGLQNLALAVLPLVALKGDAASHDPDAIARIQPMLDQLNRDILLKGRLVAALLPIGLAGTAPAFPKEAEKHYADWKPGTMDFFIEPLPINDHAHTVSKISPLWGIPRKAEADAASMPSAMLGWTGATASLENFLASFVDLGGGDLSKWPKERLAPLAEYIYSLQAPVPPRAVNVDALARGEALFRDRGCIDCHGGPRGGGLKVYSYTEIGTDAEMARWADPDLDGVLQDGLRFQPGDALTHGIKSPRLVGLWAMRLFLHNGSVDSLDEVFCSAGLRGNVSTKAFGNGGHTYGCDLSVDDRTALVTYLNAH